TRRAGRRLRFRPAGWRKGIRENGPREYRYRRTLWPQWQSAVRPEKLSPGLRIQTTQTVFCPEDKAGSEPETRSLLDLQGAEKHVQDRVRRAGAKRVWRPSTPPSIESPVESSLRHPGYPLESRSTRRLAHRSP